MFGVKATITKCIDETLQPPLVECQFTHAFGNTQVFHDKVAVFTADYLNENSNYPVEGIIGCEIIEKNDLVVKVNTELPWHIASTDCETIFEVFWEQTIEFEHLTR